MHGSPEALAVAQTDVSKYILSIPFGWTAMMVGRPFFKMLERWDLEWERRSLRMLKPFLLTFSNMPFPETLNVGDYLR